MAASLSELLLATATGHPKVAKSLQNCIAKNMSSKTSCCIGDDKSDEPLIIRWFECEFAHHRALPKAGEPIPKHDRMTEQREFSYLIAPTDI